MSLPSEVRARYVEIIDDILSKSDLSQITEKRIRNGIQDRVQYDITPQKAAIKELIMQRFDIFNARQNGDPGPVASVETAEARPTTNGHAKSSTPSTEAGVKRDADDSGLSDVVDDGPPKKKKARKAGVEDDDAAFAAKLQAEEDRAARSTRGGNSRKPGPVKKKKKTPSSKKKSQVTASDDSDVEGGGTPGRKVNRDTGFHKPMNLSSTAADFFGTAQLSRPQVTKQVWDYIKSHQLQDPGDKRYIVCDGKLKGLLKQDKVHMFQMTKILNTHMYNPEE